MAESVGQEQQTRDALLTRIRELEQALAGATSKLDQAAAERDRWRRAYERLFEQNELLRRRIFIAKAERVDVTQLELEFEETKAKLDELARSLGIADENPERPKDNPAKKDRKKPKGRRDLNKTDLPIVRIEIPDPELDGKFECIGFEESSRLSHQRGGPVHTVVARKIYKTTGADGAVALITASKPRELLNRCLAGPTMLAHLIFEKYGMGVPFHRQEARLAYGDVGIDRGTMCRYAEHVGASLGVIVDACADEARRTAFCLSTDATGVSIQPEPLEDGKRQACRKGHFFVVLADRDHIFFEYQVKHTSEAVCQMFRGFSRYIQADAHVIYNALYRGDANVGADPPKEVGCWSHTRTKFWEAAVSKHAIGGEGVYRIRRLFELDASWAKEPPQKRHALRKQRLEPLIDEFFEWSRAQFQNNKERGLVATALGYAVRQEQALRRFLDDGRLRMENNAAERGLRTIAVGRKNWLFFGSDDHAQAAANIFSLIASAKLHGIEPERYLAELIRIVPLWPRDRYLELAPKYWAATRARLNPVELATEIGPLRVPSPEQEQLPG